MAIFELIRNTRSTRSFDESVRVPDEVLFECADAARLVASSRNDQVLKFRLVSKPGEGEAVLAQTKWAGYLPELHLPPEGRHPTAFIVICHDKAIAENAAPYRVDVGIAAEAIVLAASEAGFASCMIGSFNAGKVSEALSLADDLAPALVIALGKGDEKIVLTEPVDGDVKYYRDAEGTHYVPKRSADEVILR